jgi:hypothetical protein
MQDRLNIAYDNYLYEMSKSLQSLMTAAVVAASSFETELGYFRRIVSAWFLLILACDP